MTLTIHHALHADGAEMVIVGLCRHYMWRVCMMLITQVQCSSSAKKPKNDVMHALQDLDFTFHRSFDMVRSQREALEALISCGVPRVLTSGGSQTALQVARHP